MTPTAIAYLIPGISAFVWPLILLLHKKQVLGAQWSLMVGMAFIGATLTLYSCLFNSFLCDEYLLVVLYMCLALLTPPMFHIGMSALTHRQGVARRTRIVFLPAMVMMGLMATSVLIGGSNMYRLWIARGASGIANQFFPGSTRYNLIVAVHYYLFWFAILAEVISEIIYCYRQMRRLGALLGEYYSSNRHEIATNRRLFLLIALLGLIVIISLAIFPFNQPRPISIAFSTGIIETALLLIIGWGIYHISFGAERLRSEDHLNTLPRGDLNLLGRTITHYVETERAYLTTYLCLCSPPDTMCLKTTSSMPFTASMALRLPTISTTYASSKPPPS